MEEWENVREWEKEEGMVDKNKEKKKFYYVFIFIFVLKHKFKILELRFKI